MAEAVSVIQGKPPCRKPWCPALPARQKFSAVLSRAANTPSLAPSAMNPATHCCQHRCQGGGRAGVRAQRHGDCLTVCFSSLCSHPLDSLISQSCSVLVGPSLPYYFLTWIVVALSACGVCEEIFQYVFLSKGNPLSPSHQHTEPTEALGSIFLNTTDF